MVPRYIMPVTRNLRIRNTHNNSTEHPLLPCTYEGCGRQFKSKSALTKHNRTSHFPDTGPSGSRSSDPPGEADEHQYFCTVPGCLRSFKTKLALAQHSRKQHSNSSNRPAPVTAPSSPISSRAKSLHEPSTPSHLSGARTPLFFPDDWSQPPYNTPAGDQPVDFDYEPDVDYNDDNNFIPPGSDEPHLDGMYSPSGSPSPARDGPSPSHTNPSSAHDGTSGPIKRSYHSSINGMFIYIYTATSQLINYQGHLATSTETTSTPQPLHLPIAKLTI